ncbi:protein kinase domain-containing protein [Tautonia sociabilis]|uniref:Tetratricopeptide repeat protein n=1 Tax=Tautonia sociabilis TaxID=2080755 RepID=A0A432MNU9_9BACT|nr:tetratricopeptide repeat protein [Tautonia sociabilis]RUL88786.1 tetratricopeptide repeat protein [Tautonia sociabilis]
MTEPSSPISLATTSGRTWDDASSPAAARLARRFEDDWRRSPPHGRPDPARYLPDSPDQRPGAWLALLRADLGLRWEAGDRHPVERYLERYPDLDDQVLVGLLYEEFCLREEAGAAPDPSEFDRRFPELAPQLRRVLDIHELIGGANAPTLGSLGGTVDTGVAPKTRREGEPRPDDPVEFPEAGETIGGFRLAEELGRGSFARVYLAHERLLADRPVALKVASAGSREPQTLARLQHTHIVPVHSYRVDPVTGLHLLCMPFFGRTTLAAVLADPATATARSGAELLEVLDRLEPPPPGAPRGETAARRALAARSFSGGIAWWGARLAEALQHAHDRGVLHRDVKPTNVLVTADGLPMLLDFNLALGPMLDGPDDEPAKLGGTIAYMAPEHIEALADGVDTGVDARADVFALGVVLFEAIAGTRPFPVVKQARSVPEALLMTAQQRREGAPPLLRGGRPISPALEAVIRRSLEPDPERRYQSAAELAADLQAVADDGPLRVALEPLGSRSVRWARRHRLRFAVAAPFVVAAAVAIEAIHQAQVNRMAAEDEVERSIGQADLLQQQGKLNEAIQIYQRAAEDASRYPSLSGLARQASDRKKRAQYTRYLSSCADELFDQADRLRYRLFGFVAPEWPLEEDLREVLRDFRVFEDVDWASRPDIALLRPEQRGRLLDEVPELLFLRAIHQWLSGRPRPALANEVADLRDRAVRAMPLDDPRRAPWDRLAREVGVEAPAVSPSSAARRSGGNASMRGADAAFLWGIAFAARFQGTEDPADADLARAWLERASRHRPDSYWPRFYLATFSLEMGRTGEALRHADAAVALKPTSAWARFNRAIALWESGNSVEAEDDLRAAAELVSAGDLDHLGERIELNLGLLRFERGDREAARAHFRRLLGEAPIGTMIGGIGARGLVGPTVATGSGLGGPVAELVARAATSAANGSPFARAAKLNLARLDHEQGRADLALLAYSDLLFEQPGHREARLGRALLRLGLGDAEGALADSAVLARSDRLGLVGPGGRPRPPDPVALAESTELHARCLLELGRAEASRREAEEANRISPAPSRARLELRATLATRPGASLRLDDPRVIDLLPNPGPALAADLRAAAEALAEPPAGPEPSPVPRRLTRAVLLACLGDASEAIDEATEAVLGAPDSAHPRLVRARIRHRMGELDGALADLDAALALHPDDEESLTLRGLILAERGRPPAALADLDRARALGRDDADVHRGRAVALAALGRLDAALAEASTALARDPHDPTLALLRARLLLRAGRADEARADLELARSWSVDRPELKAVVSLWRRALSSAGSGRGGSANTARASGSRRAGSANRSAATE